MPAQLQEAANQQSNQTEELHHVERGENLTVIAREHNTSVEELVALNKDRYRSLEQNPDYIQTDWDLRLPPRPELHAETSSPQGANPSQANPNTVELAREDIPGQIQALRALKSQIDARQTELNPEVEAAGVAQDTEKLSQLGLQRQGISNYSNEVEAIINELSQAAKTMPEGSKVAIDVNILRGLENVSQRLNQIRQASIAKLGSDATSILSAPALNPSDAIEILKAEVLGTAENTTADTETVVPIENQQEASIEEELAAWKNQSKELANGYIKGLLASGLSNEEDAAVLAEVRQTLEGNFLDSLQNNGGNLNGFDLETNTATFSGTVAPLIMASRGSTTPGQPNSTQYLNEICNSILKMQLATKNS